MMHAEAIAHLTLAAHGLRVEAAVATRAAKREPHHRMLHLQAVSSYRDRAAQIDNTIQQLAASQERAAA